MADNKEVLGLDLDVSSFTDGLNEAKEGLASLSKGSGLEDFSDIIEEIGAGIGVIGVSALALKVTFDKVFEGDQIKRTEDLFNNLADSFDVAGESLKNDLLKAAGGMADTNSVLDAANKSMIMLGKNSSMLPDIMTVAKKVTLEFGGDLTQNFQRISSAIATGNTRLLRQSGIVIDAKTALDTYAKSIGATADELNESGRQQATFNALMQFSSTNLKSVSTELDNSTTAWIKLKTEVKEATDAIAVAFSNTFGPAITGMFHTFTGLVHDAATTLKAEFGTNAEKSAASLEILENRANSFRKAIDQMEQKKGFFSWLASGLFANKGADALKKLQQGLADTEKQIEDIEKKQKEGGGDNTKNVEGNKTKIVAEEARKRDLDQETVAKNEQKRQEELTAQLKKESDKRLKFEEDTVKLQEQNADKAVTEAKSDEELKTALAQRRAAAEKRASLDKQKIDQEEKFADVKNSELAAKKKAEIDQQLIAKEKQYDKDYQKEHKKMLQNQLDDSKTVFQGISNAAKQASDQASDDIKNFGKQGQLVVHTFQKEGSSMFQSFGQAAIDHSQSASQIMKGFFLNSLADIAQAEGELFLTAGLADPTKLAAGAALLALSGALRAIAGNVGASSSSLGSYGGGSGTTSAASSTSSPAANTTPTGSLTVNIQGDYLNTAETQRTLLQSIRDATDQTGFQYLQIGQTGAQSN